MAGNTFGTLFRLTTYGESHGPGLGGVVDGCPAGIPLAEADIQRELDLRRPGGSPASTARKEPDTVRLLSGVFEGQTTGTPIAFHIENRDHRSADYSAIKDLFRPGHADLTYRAKFGVRDYRGGGRASGRETVSRVAGGAVALALLARHGISVAACTLELGGIPAALADPEGALSRPFFSPDPDAPAKWEERIREAKSAGDSLGGIVQVEARGVPAGLGEPVFDKLDARLAYALMGVGAVKAVEIGAGLAAARAFGSTNNDPILPAGGSPAPAGGSSAPAGFATNHAGGILGGISTGAPLIVRAAVKPIPSIAIPLDTVTTTGQPATITTPGRHDVCAIPRIVPVLKAMVALCLADFVLLQKRL